MVFKLVRTDIVDPCKIQLPIGTHVFGRGKFLDCDDKRVSRNHGEIVITDDSVTIKALHQNPCFFIKKGSDDIQILKQTCSVELCNGDKFALLPEVYWYELLHCAIPDMVHGSVETTVQAGAPESHNKTTMSNSTCIDEVNTESYDNNQEIGDHEREGNYQNLEGDENRAKYEPSQEIGSQNNAQIPDETGSDQADCDAGTASNSTPINSCVEEELPESPSLLSTENFSAQNCIGDEPKSPLKRNHSPEPDVDIKKVKIEPEVKQEADNAAAGPSNDGSDSSKVDSKDKDGAPSSPAKQPAQQRERCIYGANCYRRNPQHKAQFSHPSDADWGAGERGVCPIGSGCRRRDPRHWVLNDHPPGTHPPAPAPDRGAHRIVKKKRSDSPEVSTDLIVTGKRQRKQIRRERYESDSEREYDPYQSDTSDEWQMPSDYTESQDTQDF